MTFGEGQNQGMTSSTVHAGLLAAVDIGSNSCRLEIGQLQEGRYRRVDYLKESVRLGAGLDAHGMLTEEATQRGLRCLRGFAARLEGFAVQQVRAVATQTLREARNRDAFLRRAQDALGFPVEVISGREEARLIYAGVAHLQPSDRPRLVVDIGGRSTEMILGQGLLPLSAESFGVGCVSLSMRFFPDGRFTPEAFEAAQVAAEAEFEEALDTFAPSLWREALGSSGTAGAISEVLSAAGQSDGTITEQGLNWCVARCLEVGRIDKLKLPGLKGDRAAVVGGGLAILKALFSQFGITQMAPTRGALRQGVIFDLSARLHAKSGLAEVDLRGGSVLALQKRFGVDVAQAKRVREVALAMYEQVCPDADATARNELAWACDLHEMGLMVSHHDHHRHSAYLISNADAAGFSQSQQRRMGELVLGQRGGLRKLETALARDGFAWQLLCLRLAVIKCHARGQVDGDALQLTVRGTQAVLEFSADWAGTHPRKLYLLKEEADTWKRGAPLQLVLRQVR